MVERGEIFFVGVGIPLYVGISYGMKVEVPMWSTYRSRERLPFCTSLWLPNLEKLDDPISLSAWRMSARFLRAYLNGLSYAWPRASLEWCVCRR
jgi:hypothetical protein